MKIKLHKDAEKYLAKLPAKQAGRILEAINKLPSGYVAPLQGRHPELRLRVGDWRVIFVYQNDIIFVKEIGNRGDIYK